MVQMLKFVPLVLLLLLSGCSPDESNHVVRLSGKTMGTAYHVVAVDVPAGVSAEMLKDDVESVLKRVNSKLSNWDKQSEVSRFNASTQLDPIPVSQSFLDVMIAADEVHAKSDGKFDVTLGPLVELWGFGPRTPEVPVPSDAEISSALGFVGQAEKLHVDPKTSTLSKTASEVGVNLSAIAKGFGIDAVASELRTHKIENYMVEIGGDLVTHGHNDKNEAWRIGIETPEVDSQSIELVVALENRGLATSGDYRNFFEQDGVRYSHVIDPTTGRPITHWTTSVSVLADNAMIADAWATAMLVLGVERGLEIAEEEGLAVYFISRVGGDQPNLYATKMSSAFEKLLEAQ
ncbi:MAG: FAD:protein FMN transferase [Rhodobacteraceae bacterium]|nr:FAD:protein FMN transferase [Paracoccaceae bacterium]